MSAQTHKVTASRGDDTTAATTTTNSTRASLLLLQQQLHEASCGDRGKRARADAHDNDDDDDAAQRPRSDGSDDDVWIDCTPRAAHDANGDDTDMTSARTTVVATAADVTLFTPSAQKTRVYMATRHDNGAVTARRSAGSNDDDAVRRLSSTLPLLLPPPSSALPATVSRTQRGDMAATRLHDGDGSDDARDVHDSVVRAMRSNEPPTTTRAVELKPGYAPPSPRSPLWSNWSPRDETTDDDNNNNGGDDADDDDAEATRRAAQRAQTQTPLDVLGVYDPLQSTPHRDDDDDVAASTGDDVVVVSASLFAHSPPTPPPSSSRAAVVDVKAGVRSNNDEAARKGNVPTLSVAVSQTQDDAATQVDVYDGLSTVATQDDSHTDASEWSLTQEAARLTCACAPTVTLRRRRQQQQQQQQACDDTRHGNSAAAIAALLARTTYVTHAANESTTPASREAAAMATTRSSSQAHNDAHYNNSSSSNGGSGSSRQRRDAEAWARDMRHFFDVIDQRPLLTVRATRAVTATARRTTAAAANTTTRTSPPHAAASGVRAPYADDHFATTLARIKAEAHRGRAQARYSASTAVVH